MAKQNWGGRGRPAGILRKRQRVKNPWRRKRGKQRRKSLLDTENPTWFQPKVFNLFTVEVWVNSSTLLVKGLGI